MDLRLLLLGSLCSLCSGAVLQTNVELEVDPELLRVEFDPDVLTVEVDPDVQRVEVDPEVQRVEVDPEVLRVEVDPEVPSVDRSVRFLTHLQTALKRIGEQLEKHEGKIESLEKLNADQTVQINKLEELNAEQAGVIQELQSQNQEQAIKLAQSEEKIQELMKQKQEERVGFSAALGGSGYTGPVNTDITLIYGVVLSNTGNAYNSSSGIFTAPHRGLYHFEFHCYVGGGPGTGVKLQKNGEHIVHAEEYQPSGSGMAGNSASLQLEPGDTVFLILDRGARIFDNSNHLSTFSGRLVFLF